MKILVIRYSGLGDIVMLLQTLVKVKEKYKNSEITLLTDKSNVLLKELSNNVIDKTISIDRKIFKDKKIFKSIREIFKLYKQIREKYDLLIDFQNFGETATISYLANASIKIGAPKKDKYNYGYTKIIKRDESGHRSQFFSRIAEVDDKLSYSKIYLNDEGTSYKSVILKKIDINKKTIGLNIGSTQENRRWDEKKFSKLATKLKENFNVIIFIGPYEKKFKYAFNADTMFIENVNLICLCGAISICDVMITNDTGPAHLAAALDVPTLTLFSTGDDENVGSLIKKKSFIKKQDINDISENEVLNKVYPILL